MDCVNLKSTVTDSPWENLSAFALEMIEISHVHQSATDKTLVLIDELGKGTEVMSGTAITASIFKSLYDRHSIGILATHLHKIKLFRKDFPEAAWYKMELQTANGKKEPTWRMVPGFSEESLGLEVALEEGMPPSIVQRAEQLISSIDHH